MKSKYGFETTKERSLLMSKIKSSNTIPELLFRKRLWAEGIRYRISNKNIFGNPDITIRKSKIAIFIDGSFWHGYKWNEKKVRINSNKKYWVNKIEHNIERDIDVKNILTDQGWIVLRFWDWEIKKKMDLCMSTVMLCINSRK